MSKYFRLPPLPPPPLTSRHDLILCWKFTQFTVIGNFGFIKNLAGALNQLRASTEKETATEAAKRCQKFLAQSWLMGINVATDAGNDWRMNFNAQTVFHYVCIPDACLPLIFSLLKLPPGAPPPPSLVLHSLRRCLGPCRIINKSYSVEYTWHLRKFDWKISNILFAAFPGLHNNFIWCERKYELICQFQLPGRSGSRTERLAEDTLFGCQAPTVLCHVSASLRPPSYRPACYWYPSACAKLRVPGKRINVPFPSPSPRFSHYHPPDPRAQGPTHRIILGSGLKRAWLRRGAACWQFIDLQQ